VYFEFETKPKEEPILEKSTAAVKTKSYPELKLLE
jgi:hypothetical protein